MNFLADIIERKKLSLARAREAHGVEDLRARAFDVRRAAEPHRLRGALPQGRLNIIAEVKRASPSQGLIRADVSPSLLALAYEAGGAAAVSVLTEEARFQGSLDDLREVRAAVSIPLLRKDFIFDEFQLYEAAEAGADALLLIVAALDDETLERFRRLTEDDLGMDALVEVHTSEELRRALASGASLIGVNNRNLQTFEVSLDVSAQLAQEMPQGVTRISESGIRTGADLNNLRALGYHGFLIGESLMRAHDPGQALRALLHEAEEKEARG
ncbi:MAG TPA: indole-3-glycerol phosphate synthase TrpC [Pyrinomonadaceae bacterium]|nr:indole-3-glycerol phosphate synthase TrpC [Pyrinomonadaceae bacterium]